MNTSKQDRTGVNGKDDLNHLMKILGGSQDVIYLADPASFDLFYVNRAFTENSGEVLNEGKCFQVLHGRKDPCPFCTNDRILGEHLGETYVWEFQNQDTDRYYRCTDRAVRWSDGSWVRLEIAADITQRVQVEKELREKEARYRALAEASPQMIFMIDRQDRVIYLNPAAAEMFRVNPQEILGKPRRELFPTRVAENQAQSLEQVIATGQKIFTESQVPFPGGEIWLSTWLVPVQEEDQVQAVLGISQDITQRQQAEVELAEKLEELERFNRMAVGRELRMLELKQEVNQLLIDQGKPARYSIPEKDPNLKKENRG